MGVNYYLPPELEERKRKYLDIPQYKKTGGRNVGQGGPGSLDKLLAKRKREGEAFRHKHEAGVQQMRGDWMGIKPAHQQIEASKQAILEESIENLKNLIPPPSDRPPTKQQLMRQGMKNTQLERQQTIKDIAEYRAANPLESDVGPPQFVDKSGITGEGQTDQVRATDPVIPGSTNEEGLITNDLNNNDDVKQVAVRSTSNEKELNDGLAVNNEELERLTAEDQALASGEIQRETTFGPEGVESIKISEGPGEPNDTTKAEVKDGPFATAADTFNTVNSMIKGLSTIMANMNPDAKSATFANVDYFDNKNALENWRKKMYGSQSRA